MITILFTVLPLMGTVSIPPEVVQTLEFQNPGGSLNTNWVVDGIIGESLLANEGLLNANRFDLIVHPSSLGELDEYVQREGTCLAAPFVTKDIQADIFYFPTVNLGANSYSIVPESIGTETSAAWAYCIEINPTTWEIQPLGPDLITDIPSHWCIVHYFDISDATIWYWNGFERPLMGIFEHSEADPMMFKEFLIGETSYYTTTPQAHTLADNKSWVLHLGYQYLDGSIKLSSDSDFCEMSPLILE